ncbi:hypothetical protein ACFFLF_16470, partial [Pallidibacillus thermolactis subsp. kokeshiiformis]
LFSKQLAMPITEKRVFNRIRILGSTSFQLPAYYDEYKGANESGVKIQLEYELYQSTFLHCKRQILHTFLVC